jgi:hypothetical protein
VTQSSARHLPHFIAVGAARTGTTWLHSVLSDRVALPLGTKETDFFGKRYEKGLEWYRSHFQRARASDVIAEVCPTYFDSQIARDRIARDIPDCRIICTLRDPVDRLYSVYKMMRTFAWTRVPFEQAITKHRQMLDSSRYTHHVGQWRRLFGAASVLIAIYDDLQADAQAFVSRICRFVGIGEITIDRSPIPPKRPGLIATQPRSRRLARIGRDLVRWLDSHRLYGITNSFRRTKLWSLCFAGGEPYPELDAATQLRLRAHFVPEVEALESMLQRDLSDWKRGRSRLAARPP